jgi:hypothetical protein
MPFPSRFGSEENLLQARAALSSAALWLMMIQTDDHPKVVLSQCDDVHGWRTDAGSVEQLLHGAIDCAKKLISWEIIEHGEKPCVQNRFYIYIFV